MNQKERQNRVIARGEHSNHAHVVTGNATVERKDGFTYITAHDDTAKIRHILESTWLAGQETWTKEHHDIDLKKGTYKYIQQVEFNPLNEAIQSVAD